MNAQPKNQYAMQDPTKQYPQPKFEEQPQSVPGLARDMNPKPDHGEESYRGFGRLEGRCAVITGADSGITDGGRFSMTPVHLALLHAALAVDEGAG